MRQHHSSPSATSPFSSARISRRGLLTTGPAVTALTAAGLAPLLGAAPAHGAGIRAADAEALVDANSFEITHPVRVLDSRTSFAGTPLVSYRDSGRDLSFVGQQIARVGTGWGELVTVTIQHVPDAFVRTFTLVVPTIRVAPGDEVAFDTLGIEITDRSGAFVPPPGPSGVLQTYRTHRLHGTAQQLLS